MRRQLLITAVLLACGLGCGSDGKSATTEPDQNQPPVEVLHPLRAFSLRAGCAQAAGDLRCWDSGFQFATRAKPCRSTALPALLHSRHCPLTLKAAFPARL